MKSDEPTRFVRVEFNRFKAFKRFSLSLRHFNILVGPNNAGKSTILAAFRILAAGMRRAYSRSPEVIRGPMGTGMTHGYRIDLSSISIAEENLFYNYDDSEAATIRFKISNSNELLLYLQDKFDVNITPTSIVDAMTAGEIPKEMKLLLADLGAFSSMKPEETD